MRALIDAMTSNDVAKRASISPNDAFEDAFEHTLAAVSASLKLQRRLGRRQLLHAATSNNSDGSLGEEMIKMVSAVTQANEPPSREHREVVLWTRDSIENFSTKRAQRALETQGGLSRLPPDVAADALSLIHKLSSILE